MTFRFDKLQEGVTDPPSVSSINRLLRGSDRRDDDGRKDYSIHGILGGKFSACQIVCNTHFLNRTSIDEKK